MGNQMEKDAQEKAARKTLTMVQLKTAIQENRTYGYWQLEGQRRPFVATTIRADGLEPSDCDLAVIIETWIRTPLKGL